MRRAVSELLRTHPDDPQDVDWYRREVEAIIGQIGAARFYQVIQALRARAEIAHLDDFEIALLWSSAGPTTLAQWCQQIDLDRLRVFLGMVGMIPAAPEPTAWCTVAESVAGSEDMLMTIPPEVLSRLGWQAGDELRITLRHDRPYPYACITKIPSESTTG